ncbi:hypothetical protein DFH09DRAFT_1128303 [Mycena vulgaris]|nr:hypothetical protein DFH09DRAFT_1128303 [Mycena vulgaris]
MGVRDTRDILPLLGRIMAPLTTLKLPIQQMNWCGPDVVETSIFFPLKLPSPNLPTLLMLQTHSSFALQELRLIFFQLSFPVFSKFLREMPSLATAGAPVLMEFLTYDERKPVLPNLADLDLFDRHKYFSERAMMRMVESRWRAAPAGAPLLQRVRISTQTQPNPIFASRGSQMNEEGLSFQHEIVI